MALGQSLDSINKAFVNEDNRYKRIAINEIPFMIGMHGEIVCIPKDNEVFAAAIVGASGSGKTLMADRMISSLFHQWECNVAIMNDVSEETYAWSEPVPEIKSTENFWLRNRKYLNQEPCPSPLVYLYPSTSTLTIPETGKNKIKISLPFRDIIENIGFYLSGVSPNFELAKSELYVNNIKEQLAECETVADVKNTLDELLPGKEGKNFQAMRIKIMTAFGALMKEQILNITNPECPSRLKTKIAATKFFEADPFSVLMKARWIPSFITSDLITKRYKSEVFAYYINNIFQNNLKNFPQEKTFLFFDELKDVCVGDSEPSAQAIGRIAARGRINNVGLIYCTQFYDKIPHSVRGAKLNYCFSFYHGNNDIIREIGSDFDLDNDEKKRIKNLKKFEILAMTNNKFVCYRDGERYEETKPIQGQILFPFANHLNRGEKRNV